MTIIRLFSLLFFSFFAFTPLIGQSVYQLKKPETRDDGWQTAFVGDVIQDTVPLFKVMEQLARGESQLHSVLLLQNNTLVFEEYYGNYKLDSGRGLGFRKTTLYDPQGSGQNWATCFARRTMGG